MDLAGWTGLVPEDRAQSAKVERLRSGHPGKTERSEGLAGWTGLEPAASGVTGRRSNQLNYHP